MHITLCQKALSLFTLVSSSATGWVHSYAIIGLHAVFNLRLSFTVQMQLTCVQQGLQKKWL